MKDRATHDAKGNLLPMMLSELIEAAQDALREHGDMLVWTEGCIPGYDDNQEYSVPVEQLRVDRQNIARRSSYWIDDKLQNAFVLIGN